MTTTQNPLSTALHAVFSGIPRAARILILGPASQEAIDGLESEAGAVVEHLVFTAEDAAVLKLTHASRRVHVGRKSLAALRFDLATCFMAFSGRYPEPLVISVLSSHGDVLLVQDSRALAPDAGGQQLAGIFTANVWADRRRLFLTRLLNEFGFLQIEPLEIAEATAPAQIASTCYLVRRGVHRPLLVHVHVPKTGGISILRTLERSFPDKALFIDSSHHRGNIGNTVTIHSQLILHSQPDAISSHLLRFSYPSVVGGRAMLYFTFLRNPAEQFKSLVRFYRYNPSLFTAVPEGSFLRRVGEMSMIEIADTLMGKISGDDLDSRMAMPCRFFGLTDKSEPVIRKLMSFVLVGVFERMDESLELLRAKLAPYEIDLQVSEHPHVNSSKGTNITGEPLPSDHQAQEAALEAYGAIEDFLRARHAGDFELYDWAVANFEAQWREFKGGR